MSYSRRPPPLDFLPVQVCDTVEYVEKQPEFIRRQIRRGRRLQGVKYEAEGQKWLKAEYGGDYTAGPWFRFTADSQGKWRWCQPDGLLTDKEHGTITIVEFKYQHTENAWWQLFKLYLPVVRAAFVGGNFTFRCLEVCKWFDPSTLAPQKVTLCKNVEAVQSGEFGVHIWKP